MLTLYKLCSLGITINPILPDYLGFQHRNLALLRRHPYNTQGTLTTIPVAQVRATMSGMQVSLPVTRKYSNGMHTPIIMCSSGHGLRMTRYLWCRNLQNMIGAGSFPFNHHGVQTIVKFKITCTTPRAFNSYTNDLPVPLSLISRSQVQSCDFEAKLGSARFGANSKLNIWVVQE